MTNTDLGPAVTVGGLLLFGKSPRRFLPQAGIDAVAFPGTETDLATIERTSLRGPVLPLASPAGLVENGLVEEAGAGTSFLFSLKDYLTFKSGGQLLRTYNGP